MLKRCLTSLAWFPAFLRSLKAIVKIFRSKTNLEVVSENLKSRGLAGPAQMIGTLAGMRSFAKWRWHTLQQICDTLEKALHTLCRCFDPGCLKCREPATVNEVTNACFVCVHEVSDVTGRLMSWGAGCACHEQELFSDISVVCKSKGEADTRGP